MMHTLPNTLRGAQVRTCNAAPERAPERIDSAGDMERFARRLASTRPSLALVQGADESISRVHVTPTVGLHAGVAMLLRGELAPAEQLLARLLSAWGDAIGAVLFFELWGEERRAYGDEVSRLRGAALAGPKGKGAEHLEGAIAAELWQGAVQAEECVSEASILAGAHDAA